jgi:hypothetical protein
MDTLRARYAKGTGKARAHNIKDLRLLLTK